MSDLQEAAAIAIDREFPTTRLPEGFKTPEQVAELVDLGIAYKPVLMRGDIKPKKAVSRLSNGKFAIYDVGWCDFERSRHRWNVTEEALKIHRARFLLQRDLIYQDLIMGVGDRDDAPHFFRHWTGGLLLDIMPWEFRSRIVPLYFPDGVFIPSPANPLAAGVIKNYVYADGTIDVLCKSY